MLNMDEERVCPNRDKEMEKKMVILKSLVENSGKLYYNYSIIMNAIQFEWDDVKAKTNKRKHDVTFEEAKTVFWDDNARLIHDPDHSDEEERFLMLGLSFKQKLMLVVHCYRDDGNVVRLISARNASKNERKQYEELKT